MNKRLLQFLYNSVPMLTMIDCRVSIGATGAVSSSSGNLVSSVTRVSQGIYRLNLQGPLNAFIGFHGSMIEASGDTFSGISSVEADSSSPADMTDSSPTFDVKTLDETGAPVDPTNGSILCVMLYGRNSSVSK